MIAFNFDSRDIAMFHRRELIRFCALACGWMFASAALAASVEVKPTLGQKVANFELNDYRGSSKSLADYADKPVVVLAFLGTECPLAKMYGTKLGVLARELESRGVVVLGISSNRQDSITELAAYARDHKIDFPILKDVGNHLADAVGARRTPEVVVLDGDRVVRYQGRVDDQYVVGRQRPEPTRQDLRMAVEELLANKPVSQPQADVIGCLIGRVREPKADSEITYSNQIARLFQNHCSQCHREGEIGPFSLTSYEDAAGWADMIAEVVREKRMPPWHADEAYGSFHNDRRLSDADKKLIYDWVAAGAPEGDPADLPAPREYVEGWRLEREPELVIYMRDEPFAVPAEGEVRYQNFVVDPGFTEDKWVQMAQVLPGNPSVVHHIIVFVRDPNGKPEPGERNGRHFASYVPGLVHSAYPRGMAKRIPAGSKLVFQVHYTPTGSPQLDRSCVGFIFTDESTVKYEAQTRVVGNQSFAIPPHADDYEVKSNLGQFAERTMLLALAPHMHLRGKSFRYEIDKPDGATEVLLNVPHYDFNWQTNYEMGSVRWMEPGTVIRCTATFDNSENNIANPDPSATVRWGDQTWEEMMLGYYEVAISREGPASDDTGRMPARKRAKAKAAANAAANIPPETILQAVDKNKNSMIERDEAPGQLAPFFDQIDADKSGGISLSELKAALDFIRGQQ